MLVIKKDFFLLLFFFHFCWAGVKTDKGLRRSFTLKVTWPQENQENNPTYGRHQISRPGYRCHGAFRCQLKWCTFLFVHFFRVPMPRCPPMPVEMMYILFVNFFRVPMPRCLPMPVVMMYILVWKFFQGTNTKVLPWDYKNCMGRGQHTDRHTYTWTSRLIDGIGPVGRFGENDRTFKTFYLLYIVLILCHVWDL